LITQNILHKENPDRKLAYFAMILLCFNTVGYAAAFTITSLNARNINIDLLIVVILLLIFTIFFPFMLTREPMNYSILIDNDTITTRIKKESHTIRHTDLKGFEVLKKRKIKLYFFDERGVIVTNAKNGEYEGYIIFTRYSKRLALVLQWILDKNNYLEQLEKANLI